ncbi:MAG: GNAT family N-acetyltransferase [Cellvibrionaceae bacterium]|nr:GNAT family N-acetyltransferase [Cellvibrionaceae bacterium]
MDTRQTQRLEIRHLNESDAGFIFRLLNDESFISNIGDKKIRNNDDALQYLRQGPIASYKKHAYGLNLVTLKNQGIPIGTCGLICRDELGYPDLGYALLPAYCAKGYAHEACVAVLEDAYNIHHLRCIVAITHPSNTSSQRLLKKLGFSQNGTTQLYGCENNLYEYRFGL